MKSLKESLFDDDLMSKDIKDIIDSKYVYPKDKWDLMSSIKYYINLTNPKEGDTVDLNWIDTSKIEDMSWLYKAHVLFYKYNYDVSKWDVSNVKYMYNMFENCWDFNCDLSKWDVSKVKNMSAMFYKCEKFNSDISKWDVSNVEDMDLMFYGCKNFNCDLSKWNVSNVKYYNVFSNCPKMKEKNKPHFK